MTYLLIFAALSILSTALAAALARGAKVARRMEEPEHELPPAPEAEQEGRTREPRGQVRARHRPTAMPRRKFR